MRQLAAIMFADMTGYTAIMQQNEQLAKAKRKRLNEVLKSSLAEYNGKILQHYGDGSLSIFSSAIDGVRSAISIQRQLKDEPRVDLRIGIHTGDVAMEDGAIYGDGVNLASRIESLSVPGGIFISEKVFDEIRNQEGITTRELGYFELKNISKPVRVFAIANEGLKVPDRDEIKGKTSAPVNRLAVLPFVNMSADPENEYFSDGITEELLNALTKVNGLQVTSRTSAFAFKGKNDDVRDIAIKLNVDKVLEGSVRKSGNRVRITAQLINAADGYHIWSENYDRNLDDIFQVQDEISMIIANRLRENLGTSHHHEQMVKAPVKNIGAYTQFLKGLHFYNKLTPADHKKAIECFETAIAMEPHYAQAYAFAAGAYAFLGATGQVQIDNAFGIVHRYSDKALQLDNKIAEGYTAKGSAYLFYDWKWETAFEYLQKSIELNPASSWCYQLIAFYYVVMKQKDKAVETMETALKADPLSPVINYYLADFYLMAGRVDDSLNWVEKLLEMHPYMRIALELKGWCYGVRNEWHKAEEIFLEVYRLTNHPLKGLSPLGCAYGKLGKTEEAMECIRKIEQRQREEPETILDGDLAMIWWSLGDKDKAFHYMFEGIRKRMGPIAMFIEHPLFEGITDDPRYFEMKKLLGLKA